MRSSSAASGEVPVMRTISSWPTILAREGAGLLGLADGLCAAGAALARWVRRFLAGCGHGYWLTWLIVTCAADRLPLEPPSRITSSAAMPTAPLTTRIVYCRRRVGERIGVITCADLRKELGRSAWWSAGSSRREVVFAAARAGRGRRRSYRSGSRAEFSRVCGPAWTWVGFGGG